MTRKLLKMTEVAAILNVKLDRVYQMAREGILPSGVIVRLGRQLRVDEERLHQFISDGGQALPGGWKKEA